MYFDDANFSLVSDTEVVTTVVAQPASHATMTALATVCNASLASLNSGAARAVQGGFRSHRLGGGWVWTHDELEELALQVKHRPEDPVFVLAPVAPKALYI